MRIVGGLSVNMIPYLNLSNNDQVLRDENMTKKQLSKLTNSLMKWFRRSAEKALIGPVKQCFGKINAAYCDMDMRDEEFIDKRRHSCTFMKK